MESRQFWTIGLRSELLINQVRLPPTPGGPSLSLSRNQFPPLLLLPASDVALATLVAEEAVDQGWFEIPENKQLASAADKDDWIILMCLMPRSMIDTSPSTSEHVIRQLRNTTTVIRAGGQGRMEWIPGQGLYRSIHGAQRGSYGGVDDGMEERRLMRMSRRFAALEQEG
ncbi:hypothetical protein HPP92_028949 [Vanilla planifolia]|uniref:Uncharacterized protein n=1 Tax=Vanilla planifolia TaxID=51239 RepID=A0A835U3A8_VANPL|nr:hypothetical protein HPP92_028939 [Vanilla planifolia]KAG0446246.1 hypothetical protein HPP92_028949 [Vanilla planifolia]